MARALPGSKLIGSDGRANPEYLRYPTNPGEQGQYVYLYGPGLWTPDLGLAKVFQVGRSARINFETLFINAFNHRNKTVGGTGGASHSIDSTTFGQSTGTAIGAREIQFGWGSISELAVRGSRLAARRAFRAQNDSNN